MTDQPQDLAPMVRLVLEVDPGCDPLAGRIGLDPESLEPFTGWTELGQAVSRLTGAGGAPEGEAPKR